MSWVPISDRSKIDETDKPRELTNEEIMFIVEHLPYTLAATNEAAQLSRQCTIEWMQSSLKNVKVCPSAIPELIERIIAQHKRSLITPGTPVGNIAAEAIGATTTQMVLNSVAPWEQILFQDMYGKGHIVKIGEWIDKSLEYGKDRIVHIPENRTEYLELPQPVKIAACDMDGKSSWERVTAVTRHLPVGDLIKIKTESGREATVTQSKSLLIWDEDEEYLQQTEGKFAKVGDMVPIFSKVQEPPLLYQEIDFRKYLSPKEWIYGSEMKKIYDDYKAYPVKDKRGFWQKEDRLKNTPYARGDSVLICCRDLDIGLMRDYCIYPKSRGGSKETMIPEKIKLDRSFGQFIGLYLAEGLATDTYVCISNNNEEIQQLIYRFCDSIGVKYHIDIKETERGLSSDIKIHSVLLARWLKIWCGTGSDKKIMPDEILFGNREFIIGVLDGYIAGDGCVSKVDGAITIGSVSKDLIIGTNFLCSRLGIFGRISGHQQKKNNIGSKNILYMHDYSIRAKNADLFAEIVGSCHPDKDRLMNIRYERNVGWGKHYIKHNDVMLDKIISIEYVKDIKYVYDLTVENTTNFSLITGLNLADTFHASGAQKSASFGIEAMKDLIYAQNPKNKVCTIYYTDKQASYEDILNSRRYIVGSVISDFIKDYEIDDPKNLERYWWHDMANILLETKGSQKAIPNSTKIMRLTLNIAEMYKQHVSIKDLADALERETPASVVAVYGPIGDGIIDVYPHPDIIEELLKKKPKSKSKPKDKSETTPILKKQKIIPVPPDLAELTYLETIVRPELSKIRVKGISEIKDLVPVVVPVLGGILLERKILESDINDSVTKEFLGPSLKDGSGWLLIFNQPLMRRTGITDKNISALCSNAGITVLGGVKEYLAISLPNDRFRTVDDEVVIKDGDKYYLKLDRVEVIYGNQYKEISPKSIERDLYGWKEKVGKVTIELSEDRVIQIDDKFYKKILEYKLVDNVYYEVIDEVYLGNSVTPSAYINNKIAKDKNERGEKIKKLTDEVIKSIEGLDELRKRVILRKPVVVDRTPLMISSEFVYAEVDGSNLSELLALPGIDKTRTTCNSLAVITATLGIEAARTYLIRALYSTISNTSSYVHPSNILLVAEFITSRGQPHGATFTGISRQAAGHLSLATLGKAGGVFAENALHARKEDIRNVSASIAVGTRMAIGNGSFDIGQDIIEDGVRKTIINDDLFTMFSRDDNMKNSQRLPTETTADEEIEQIKSMLGDLAIGQLDYRQGEKETDLLQEFTNEPAKQEVKQPSPKITTTKPIVKADLISIIDVIKTGTPIGEPLIKPLLTGTIEPTKIISEGIVLSGELVIKGVGGGLPQSLLDLLLGYNPEEQRVTITRGLPEANIPQLPPLSLPQLSSVRSELLRERSIREGS